MPIVHEITSRPITFVVVTNRKPVYSRIHFDSAILPNIGEIIQISPLGGVSDGLFLRIWKERYRFPNSSQL
jgi:hypothetical protein